jgi:hypothetical protein
VNGSAAAIAPLHRRRRGAWVAGAIVLVFVVSSQSIAVPAASAATQSISGTVSLGSTTTPAAAGEVVVTARHHWVSQVARTTDYTAHTDASGRYVFPELPRGNFELGFEYVGSGGFASQWWPSNPIPVPGVTWFQLNDQPLIRDIVLPVGASIAGTVRDSAGQPIDGAEVIARVTDRYGPTVVDSTRTGADGAYILGGLPPAQYSLESRADGYAAAILGTGLDLTSGEWQAGVDLTLYRPTSLSGRIACAECEEGVASLLTVHLEREGDTPSAPAWVEVATTRARPTDAADRPSYRFDGLAPGSYRIRITGSWGWTPLPNSSQSVRVEDGDQATVDTTIELLHFDRDFSGDDAPDVLVRAPNGAMLMYAGDGASGWSGVSTIGSGWGVMNHVFAAGDFSGDGPTDVLARDAAGRLYLYRGDGQGGWLERSVIGTGWGHMTALFSPGDFSGDGRVDVLARDGAGNLWLYPGDGAGGFGTVSRVGTGWNVFDQLFAVGDFGGHGAANVMGRNGAGDLWVYPASGFGGWMEPSRVGTGWGIFNAIFGAGDFTGDGNDDVIGRDAAGRLVLYPGAGFSGWLPSSIVGTGWGHLSFVK